MRSIYSVSIKPLVDKHNLISGALSAISSKVRKVFSGLAKGSPGPATPNTVICGILPAITNTLWAASSGVSSSLTTPGRLSLAQSYLRLQ